MTHHKFPDAERNAKQRAERHIHHKPDIKAGQDILKLFFINDIRHITREHRVKRRRREQGKNKNIKHCTRKQLAAGIPDLIKFQNFAHKHDIPDDHKHRRNRHARAVTDAKQI